MPKKYELKMFLNTENGILSSNPGCTFYRCMDVNGFGAGFWADTTSNMVHWYGNKFLGNREGDGGSEKVVK